MRTSAVRVLIVRVRSLVICSRATTSTRIATWARSLDNSRGTRNVPSGEPSTARAILVASRSSLLPVPRRSVAGIRAASTTWRPAACSPTVRIAPNEPVPSTTTNAARAPTRRVSQWWARDSPAGLVGNSACASTPPVAAATSAKV